MSEKKHHDHHLFHHKHDHHDVDVGTAEDVDKIMRKFDRESNTRIWEGIPKIIVQSILAIFALFCLYVTLFATWLEEWRLTSFVAGIVFLGYLVFPARKGQQRTNYIPWYDIVLMVGIG